MFKKKMYKYKSPILISVDNLSLNHLNKDTSSFQMIQLKFRNY